MFVTTLESPNISFFSSVMPLKALGKIPLRVCKTAPVTSNREQSGVALLVFPGLSLLDGTDNSEKVPDGMIEGSVK